MGLAWWWMAVHDQSGSRMNIKILGEDWDLLVTDDVEENLDGETFPGDRLIKVRPGPRIGEVAAHELVHAIIAELGMTAETMDPNLEEILCEQIGKHLYKYSPEFHKLK